MDKVIAEFRIELKDTGFVLTVKGTACDMNARLVIPTLHQFVEQHAFTTLEEVFEKIDSDYSTQWVG